MRERNSSASHSAAPAALAPHRIPLFRTMYVVAATILFFFLNLFFIYVYVQNESHVAFERPASHAHLAGFQDRSETAHSNTASMTAGFYSCNITDPLAVKALERAKTENCKRKITEAACKLKNGVFHDIFPVSQCSNHDQSLVGRRVGCFEDHSNNRTLDGFQYDFKGDNSPAKCRSFCYRAGFVYYGLEFGRECFCGDSVSSRPLDQDRCHEYKCPGDDSSHCGGFNAVEVFHSGFKKPYLFPKAKHEEDSNRDVTVPRILFLLQLNGRNERQVKRLFKAIYSPSHYYYIHVDQRQLYMLTEMKAVAAKIPNVFVAPDAHSTIWGGASLLTMVQDAIRRSIEMPSFSGWDYLINLSESDFPVMTLHDFETQLRLNMGKSYMSSHGYNAARFIQKQGFDFVFVECENRMWRVGKRDEFPRNLRVDGGSDWIVLHKEFALYSISDDELPTKMRNLFSSVILPVESFFHTLAYNSRFCESVIGSNLRLTNWNRKQGCRCESLKRVVDWCGCSPLVFTKEHTHKFSLKNAKAKPFYLARKFESLIDIDAVALAEEQAMRDRPHLLHTKDPMFNVTFVNHYKADIDGYSPHFSLMAETLLSMHSEQLAFLALTRIDVVKLHSSAPHQMVFTMQIRDSDTPFELLVERKLVSNIVSPAIVDGFRLEVVMAGMDIDHKEEIFRGITAYADLKSSPTIALRWSRVPDMPTSVNETKTSPAIRFKWRSADGKVVATQKLRPYDSIRGTQFASLNLQQLALTNSSAGMWSVIVQTDEENPEVIASVWFPIYSTENEPLFRSLVRDFFVIKDSCKDNCSSTTWSIFHPDPKSDILTGYDKSSQTLV